jgi:2-dehydropantoate 2-reductase
MRLLVYGAGPLGSLFAAQLHVAGHDVAILARGQRLADIREHGVVIHNVVNDETIVAPVRAVELLAPNDTYDLILVIMRKNAALTILPILAADRNAPNVLFLMNSAAGPGALIEALGRERVLIGFPASAGYRDGYVVHCLTGTPEEKAKIPFGEIDGAITPRVREIAAVLESTSGLGAEIRTDMDAWLKYHVALLMPSLGPAFYGCGTDLKRFARTRDAVVLAVRAMREGFAVLRAQGYRLSPRRFLLFAWLPEPVMVRLLQKLLTMDRMEIALAKHANAARDEIQHLVDEFLALAARTSVPTPAILALYPHLAADHPQIPDGSDEIPLAWGGLALAGGALVALAGVLWFVGRRWRLRHRDPGRRRN